MKKLLFVCMVFSITCLAACKKDVIDNKATPKPKVVMAIPVVSYDYQKAIEVKRTLNPGLNK